jgi:hypothetical protein
MTKEQLREEALSKSERDLLIEMYVEFKHFNSERCTRHETYFGFMGKVLGAAWVVIAGIIVYIATH